MYLNNLEEWKRKSYSIHFFNQRKKICLKPCNAYNCNDNLLGPRVINGVLAAEPKYLEICSHYEKKQKIDEHNICKKEHTSNNIWILIPKKAWEIMDRP